MCVRYVSERFLANGIFRDTLIFFTEQKKLSKFWLYSFEHASQRIRDNFERRKFSCNYNISDGFHLKRNNQYLSRSSLNSTHNKSDLTHELYSDGERKKNINQFKAGMILLKLEKLRFQLLSHVDVERVNQILLYLYNESILQKSTQPIEEQNLLPCKQY